MGRLDLPRRIRGIQDPVVPIIARLIAEHPGTISLGQGVVHYGPPPAVAERVAAFFADRANHRYTPDWGIPALVEALGAKLSAENGIELAGRSVVVTAGANMGFLNAVLAITDPGDEVVLLHPFYFNHEMAVRLAGCTPRIVATTEDWRPRLDAVAAAIGPRTRAVVTISPNNPTGVTYPAADLRAVNRLCRERGIYHVSDEAYECFVYDGATHFSPAALPGSREHTIALYSLSKTFGIASWRIGYMVLPERLFEPVMKVQDTNVICAPAVSQHAALACLAAGSEYCRRFLPGLDEVRGLVLDALARLGDAVRVPRADGAFYVYLRVNRALDPFAVAAELIRRDRVAVIPGSAFGSGAHCDLRVSYGALEPPTLSEGVGRLVDGLARITAL